MDVAGAVRPFSGVFDIASVLPLKHAFGFPPSHRSRVVVALEECLMLVLLTKIETGVARFLSWLLSCSFTIALTEHFPPRTLW